MLPMGSKQQVLYWLMMSKSLALLTALCMHLWCGAECNAGIYCLAQCNAHLNGKLCCDVPVIIISNPVLSVVWLFC